MRFWHKYTTRVKWGEVCESSITGTIVWLVRNVTKFGLQQDTAQSGCLTNEGLYIYSLLQLLPIWSLPPVSQCLVTEEKCIYIYVYILYIYVTLEKWIYGYLCISFCEWHHTKVSSQSCHCYSLPKNLNLSSWQSMLIKALNVNTGM